MTNADWVRKDFYAELGVAKDASAEDVKKAYRRLARANHPDSHPDDEAKHDRFKRVAEAYDVVGDPAKRAQYDQLRAVGGGFPGGGPGGFGGGAGAGGFDLDDLLRQSAGGAGAGAPGGFGDMFGDLFGGGAGAGGGRQRRRPQKGADLEATATVGFAESLEGVTISLRMSSESACETCHGSGGKPGTKPRVCPQCDGAGSVTASVGGAFSMNETCPVCHGRQLLHDEPCPTCLGSGRGTSARTIQARIPAGVKDGQRIRVRGKGAPGAHGGPAGDLFVTVKVTPHRVFGRTGDNLTLDVPISFDEAALGAEVKVPTMGGPPVTLRLPPGTPNGRTFRVRGKGVARADGTRGDLLATVEVQVPAVLDGAARAAVEAYREATADRSMRRALFEDA